MDAPLGLETGLYTLTAGARLAGITPPRAARWLNGYAWRAKSGEVRRSRPVIRRPAAGAPSMSFLDLVELRFVAAFIMSGVPMQTIRHAAEAAASFGDHPFCTQRFVTDGRTVIADVKRNDTGKRALLDLASGQWLAVPVFRELLDQLDYATLGNVDAWWPLGKKRPVVLNPRRAFGAPVGAESGVPAHILAAGVAAGQSQRAVAGWYEVPLEEVRASVDLARRTKTAA
jgi:uncharacterized protein (DUF433 family)